MLKEINLKYNFDVFLNADYNQHKGSCVSYQRREQDNYSNSYNEKNTIIHQLWFDESQVDYKDIGNQLGMEVVTISTIMQPPGNIIAPHRDTFFKINQKYPNDKRTKVRANIYLKDWEMGHILQYEHNKVWNTSTYWKQGEGFLWDSSILHIGANIGLTNKFTLQVSGFYGHI